MCVGGGGGYWRSLHRIDDSRNLGAYHKFSPWQGREGTLRDERDDELHGGMNQHEKL